MKPKQTDIAMNFTKFLKFGGTEMFDELSEKYDVMLDPLEVRRVNSQKQNDKLFVSPPSESFGLEAFSQLLPPIMKFGRIFRLRKDRVSYPATGILLRQLSGVALVPLVDQSTKVADYCKLLFGEKLYKRMMYNYVFPRRTTYKNPYIPGSKKKIKMNQLETFINFKNKYLPGLTQQPSYIIKNLKNTVFDFSDILSETLPSREMCIRPAVVKTSENIILQDILRLCFSRLNEGTPLFSTYTSTLPPVNENFKSIIIPFKITTRDKRVANVWLNPEYKMNSLMLKRNPEISSHLGILKFVVGLLNGDPFEGNEIARRLSECVRQCDHVVFLFHNDTHGFYVDYKEYIAKGMKYQAVFRYIRTSLKLLISLNNAEIADNEIDELENRMLNSNDADTVETENEVDSKINKAEEFQKELVNAANKPVTKLSPKVISLDPGKQSIDDKTLLAFVSPKAKNDLNEDKNVALLAKAQDQLNKRIELGFTNKEELANQKQTPVAALADSSSVKNFDKVTKFVNAVKNLEEDDNLDSDDSTTDDSNWDFSDDNGTDEDGNPTPDNSNVPDTTDEDTEDEDEEESDEEEEEDDDFVSDEKKKSASKTTTSIVNSIRESIEGKVTEKQQKYFNEIKNKYKSIKFDESETLEDVLNRANTISIDLHDENLDIKDKSFNKSIITDFTKSYVKKTLAQDIVKNVQSFANENKANPMAITKFEKKDISDQFNSLEMYNFELKDKYGKAHHIKFKMPKIDDDGFMKLGGNTKMLKKQFVLKPVTKTSPDEVYVMSNYNKILIFRSGINMNKNTIILDKIIKAIDKNAKAFSGIVDIYRGDNTKINIDYTTTIEYDEIATSVSKIIIGMKNKMTRKVFYFSQKEIRDLISTRKLKFDLNGVNVPYGIDYTTGQVYSVNTVNTNESVARNIIDALSAINDPNLNGIIEKAIGSVKGNVKKIFSKVNIQSKEVPLIIFLAGTFGFKKVLETGKIKTVFVNKQTELSDEDKAFIAKNTINFVKFIDGKLYYDSYPIDLAMLMNGLNELNTEELAYEDLENLGTYVEYAYDKFKTRNLIKGWIAFRDLFLDPKTLEVIEALHLPTDLLELLLYANSLLQNNSFTPSGEVGSWRIRDYEVVSDLLYQSISENYRKYMMKGKSREGFSIPEEDILTKLNKAFLLINYDTTSPGAEIREKSGVTFKGPNGINLDRAFTLDKRGQTVSNIGTEAISGPDNGNIGINRQLTSNPRIINTLGFIEPTKPEDIKNLSASSLYAFEESIPYGNCNDPKRIGFLSSQTKHLVPGRAFDVPMVGTGMECAMPYKVSSVFGYKAKQNGKVIKVDNDKGFLLVKYKDGTTDRVDFGAKYVRNSDFYLANNIDVDVKEGQNIKEGQILTHNKDYFKKTMGRLVYAQGAMARVAVAEGEVTEEDSSAISWRLSNKLATTIIKKKQIVLNHNANIVSFMKKGEHVTYGDPLMIYEDSKDSDADMALLNLLGDVGDDVLNTISRHQAAANYSGIIHDIHVYWTIDPDLMGDSTKKFVKQYINKLNEEIKEEEALTGTISKRRVETQVSKPLNAYANRINGVLVPKEGCIIVEYFIEHEADRRPGDKVAVMPALKSVIHKVMEKDECAMRINPNSKFNVIDDITSNIGLNARMVCSTYLDGFLSKILFERGKQIAEEFDKEIQ